MYVIVSLFGVRSIVSMHVVVISDDFKAIICCLGDVV